MKPKPCSICGGTDTKLIDGFYYCVECGTQDENAQETIVEHTALADGTYGFTTKRKFTIRKDAVEMSAEWHKWHTFNFILFGLVEEVEALGASPGFRGKVLWIWTRYMKKFMKKEEMGLASKNNSVQDLNMSKLFGIEDDEDESIIEENTEEVITRKKRLSDPFRPNCGVTVITKPILLTIIYLGLNYDHSDIQLSHLLRFIKEGRISVLFNYEKFIPKEMKVSSIPKWKSFIVPHGDCSGYYIREMAFLLIKALNLGPPLVPDLRKIVDNFVKELCLPSHFKNLVYSLMHKYPCDYLKLSYNMNNISRLPDYEATMMSYILIAFKMCFGLDNEYEMKLSKAVNKINSKENRLKSYKTGLHLESTDRLFSFREWCNYLQLRKVILCKYYLPMSQHYKLPVDDKNFIEQVGERPKRKIKLADEVTMDIINKIELVKEGIIVPLSEFVPTFTPLSEYTNIITEYIQDPQLKLLLSEDFTQYSLEYACMDLNIPGKDTLNGIKEENKFINKDISSKIDVNEFDMTLVYVRNCENKNWLKTKPPRKEHLTKVNKDNDGSDHEDDFDSQTNANDVNSTTEAADETKVEKVLETIEEEPPDRSIFDDDFEDINKDENNSVWVENEAFNSHEVHNSHEFQNGNESFHDLTFRESKFDPGTFDREGTIKELILFACKKYKIPIPNEYKEKLRKRKNSLDNKIVESNPKIKKVQNKSTPWESRNQVNRILDTYYTNVKEDLHKQVSQEVERLFNDITNVGNNDAMDLDNTDNNVMTSGNEELDEKDNTAEVIEATSDTENNAEFLKSIFDPKFDDKKYDIKQLYLKFREEFDFDHLLDIDEPEINEILDKKHEESKKCKFEVSEDETEENNDESLLKREDDVALKFKAEELKLQKNIEDENLALELDPLVQNHDNVTEFYYWCRHYNPLTLSRSKSIKEKFDKNIKEKYSKSFSFLVFECADMLHMNAFIVYKHFQYLEDAIINKLPMRYEF